MRPNELHWADWLCGQMDKISSAVDTLESTWADHLNRGRDIGVIAAACALGYLEFRFPGYDWRCGLWRLTA